jgi:prepilin-type processing-associated H-X9-DG protein
MVDVDKANIQASSTVSYGDKDFLRIQAYGSNALRTNDVTVFGDFRHNSDVAMDRNTPVLTAANGGGFANYNFFDGHVASATVMDFVNDPSQFDSWIFGDLQSVNAPSGW